MLVEILEGQFKIFLFSESPKSSTLKQISLRRRYFFLEKVIAKYPVITGNDSGVTGLLREKVDDKFVQGQHNSRIIDGYRLFFHGPFEVVSLDSQQFYTLNNQSVNFLIKPEMMNFDYSIVDYTPEEGNCVLPDEKVLSFLKVYNKVNCRYECLANLTLDLCGCVQFYMVKHEWTRICGIYDSPLL